VFLSGFYVRFSTHHDVTFLDELVNTDWHLQEPSATVRLRFSTPSAAAPLVALWSVTIDLQSCPHDKSFACQLTSLERNTFVDLAYDKSTDIRSCEHDFPTFYENEIRDMYDKC
jgi:hypothetical protein